MTTLPATGALSWSAIKTMLGKTTNNMNSFRALVGSYRPGTNIPTTNNSTINADIFHSKTRSGCPQWCSRAGSTLNDNGRAIAVDSGGNIYIIGQYQGTMTFYNADGSAFGTTLAQIGGIDVFVAKYNTNGAVQWVARAGASNTDQGNGIAVDSGGNVYVTGAYFGTMTFYNSSLSGSGAFATTLAPVNATDVFVAKYNTNGAVQWVARASGTSNTTDQGNGIVVDSGGNIYVTGAHSGTCTFYNSSLSGSGAFSPTLAGSATDAFVVKYNTNGAVQWVARAGSTGNDFGFGIAVDSGGNVYVTGQYAGTMTFYNSSLSGSGAFSPTLALIGSTDAFVVKYNTNGAIQWVARAGSIGTDFSRAIAVDSGGNVYITGIYAGTMTFYNSSFSGSGAFSPTLAQIGSSDVFVAKYNTNGAVQWVARAGSTGTEQTFAIALDSGGNIYITGQYQGTMTFYNADGSAFGTTLELIGSNDAYVAKYNTNGAVQWVARAVSAGIDLPYGIAVDSGGNVYVTGYYAGTMTFYNAENTAFATTLAQIGSQDVFVVKYIG